MCVGIFQLTPGFRNQKTFVQTINWRIIGHVCTLLVREFVSSRSHHLIFYEDTGESLFLVCEVDGTWMQARERDLEMVDESIRHPFIYVFYVFIILFLSSFFSILTGKKPYFSQQERQTFTVITQGQAVCWVLTMLGVFFNSIFTGCNRSFLAFASLYWTVIIPFGIKTKSKS